LPGGILALDLSRWTGWAYGQIGDTTPKFGTIRLSDTLEEARYAAFQETVEAMLEAMQPSHLVLEAPLPLPAHNSLMITAQQLTLRGIARMSAWRASVARSEIDVGTVRQDILGRRYFAKDQVKREVLRYCLRRGWRVPDHNAGDACLVWLWYARQRQGIRPAAGPLWAEAAA
jgi:Holliday junction resolvasome RuvABC endonuclease subunit